MIKINLIVVGKVKEKYFADGILEYSKRLSRFCDFNVIEVKEENFEKVDDSLIEIIKNREAQRILPLLKGVVVALAIEGKQFSSVEFADFIKNQSNSSGVLSFVIGGSYGLSDEVKSKANSLISFSKMTFPHTLFRLMLSEQIYRAFSIISKSQYHK